MKTIFKYPLIAFFTMAALIPPTKVLSAPYYEGKVIKLIVGSPPGGGTDTMARLLARHLPKHIPGNPTIIINNMPAGVGRTAANYLYNLTKPDGLTFGTVRKDHVFSQLFKVKGIKFDITKFSWLGSLSVESTIWAIRSGLPYKTMQELQQAEKKFFIAGQGIGTFGTQWSHMLKTYLRLNAEVVDYRGTSETVLALERKEADASAFAYNSGRIYIERGLIRPLVRTRVPQSGIEHLPIDEDLTNDQTAKTIFAAHAFVGYAARPYVAPPGIPVKILELLRNGFVQALKDPELQADTKRSLVEVNYVSPEECLKVMKFVLNQPPEIVQELGKFIK